MVNLLSYLAVKMHSYVRDIVNDLANADLELLRIHSQQFEYFIAFEEDMIVISIYKQPNENAPVEEEEDVKAS